MKKNYTAQERHVFIRKAGKQVKALNCAQKENQVAPENAYVSFNDSEFTIVPETEGSELKCKGSLSDDKREQSAMMSRCRSWK